MTPQSCVVDGGDEALSVGGQRDGLVAIGGKIDRRQRSIVIETHDLGDLASAAEQRAHGVHEGSHRRGREGRSSIARGRHAAQYDRLAVDHFSARQVEALQNQFACIDATEQQMSRRQGDGQIGLDAELRDGAGLGVDSHHRAAANTHVNGEG